jgi:hypothetical protein
MDTRLSTKLEVVLSDIEDEIKKLLREKSFYLQLGRKDYAAYPEGQALVKLTSLAINLRYEIDALKKHGF